MGAKSAELVTTATVRRAFLDFFQQRGHALLPGSPVLPLGDPSVPFVPAGMHQFRHVLLGRAPPPSPQVANSQRCVRVGGRHCDLASVGSDGSHLTFFEMLGSWTFGGSYWKHEVCSDALNFLTGPLRIDSSRLHVTYFEGNAELGADQECYDAWRSLGVDEDRIRACPAVDNMWEMGASGPCGPCTEIHVDGVEIWNLVFVEQERALSGALSPLGVRSIDTGMGLERLSALLAGRSSVYDTDTFEPLLEAVAKFTGATPYGGMFDESRDAAYRLLVDHARTVAVALADGILPDRHYKLRRIMRRCLVIAERQFGVNSPREAASLLEELAIRTIENLSEAHPTLSADVPAVKHLIHYEADVFSKLRNKEPDGWAEAVAEEPRLDALAEGGFNRNVILQSWRVVLVLAQNGFRRLSGYDAYRLYDRHGIGLDILDDLAKFTGMAGVDSEEFEAVRNGQKDLSRLRRSLGRDADLNNFDMLPVDLPPTDTTPVYSYTRSEDGNYLFQTVRSKVLAILEGGKLVDETVPKKGPVGIVLCTTNMFRNRGGQHADRGKVKKSNGAVLNVVEPVDVGVVVVHWGEVEGGSIAVGDEVEVSIDEERRSALMKNHTAAHLFNSCLREHLAVASQKHAPVIPGHFSLALDTYGKKLTNKHLESAEEKARALVKSAFPVVRKNVTAWNWHSSGPVTFIPDAAYPTLDLSVIQIGSESTELCGGTHVVNTADIGDVCIVKAGLKSSVDVTVVTGKSALIAIENGERLLRETKSLMQEVDEIVAVANPSNVTKLIEVWKRCNELIEIGTEGNKGSYLLRQKSAEILNDAINKLEKTAGTVMKLEVAEAACDRFAAVFVQSCCILETVQLMKATRPLRDKALLLVTILRDGSVRGRCCVPEDLVTKDFDAVRWLKPVAKALNGRIAVPPGFKATNVCLLDKIKCKPTSEEVQLLVDNARTFAECALEQRVACV